MKKQKISPSELFKIEKDAAKDQMAYEYANLHMPEDIRSRARAWGMEAWAEVLWNNAFQCGWRQAKRTIVCPEHSCYNDECRCDKGDKL